MFAYAVSATSPSRTRACLECSHGEWCCGGCAPNLVGPNLWRLHPPLVVVVVGGAPSLRSAPAAS
eukprot:11228135-Lingulodinium_polyedra.AAC.1